MTDKADYTGTIRAKGLTGTGITEAIIGRHHRDQGGRLMVVASIHAAGRGENLDEGTGSVAYVIDELEVAPEGAVEHIRELVRSFHYERKLATEGPTLDYDGQRGDEPTVEQVVAAGGKFERHPFIPDDAAKDTPICDVCGLVEDHGVHITDDTDDDDTAEAGDEGASQDVDKDDTSSDEPPLDDQSGPGPAGDPFEPTPADTEEPALT